MEKQKPNSSNEIEDNIKKVAKNLGINLDDDATGKAGKESNLDKKTETETTEVNSGGETDNAGDDAVYKEKYAAATREFQEKYKPMEDEIKQLEQITGKKLGDLISEYGNTDTEKDKDTKSDLKDVNEVNNEIASLKEMVQSLVDEVSRQKEKDKLSAKEKVNLFREKYSISEDEYAKKIYPTLEVVQNLRKDNGDPYTLEETLEAAYIFANRDNIEKIAEKKAQLLRKEEELVFSPKGGSKESSSTETPKYTELQKEVARKLKVNLEEE